MRRLAALAPALGLALVGCAPTTTFVKTNASPKALAARPVDGVAVFTASAPDRPYVEVGIISSITTVSLPDRAALLAAIRAEAAARGCEGLIVSSGTSELAEGTCIVFR